MGNASGSSRRRVFRNYDGTEEVEPLVAYFTPVRGRMMKDPLPGMKLDTSFKNRGKDGLDPTWQIAAVVHHASLHNLRVRAVGVGYSWSKMTSTRDILIGMKLDTSFKNRGKDGLDPTWQIAAVVHHASLHNLRVRAVGVGYSWSKMTSTRDILIDMSGLTRVITKKPQKYFEKYHLVEVQAGKVVREFVREIDIKFKLALPGMDNFMGQTVGGAVCTSAHGSGFNLQSIELNMSELYTSEEGRLQRTTTYPDLRVGTHARAAVARGAGGVLPVKATDVCASCYSSYVMREPSSIPGWIDNCMKMSIHKGHYVNTWYKVLQYNKGTAHVASSEWSVALEDLEAALGDVIAMAVDYGRKHNYFNLMPLSCRLTKSDEAYLSLANKYRPDGSECERYAHIELPYFPGSYGVEEFHRALEDMLYERYQARAHWAKNRWFDARRVHDLYPALEHWKEVYTVFNSDHTFDNQFTARCGFEDSHEVMANFPERSGHMTWRRKVGGYVIYKTDGSPAITRQPSRISRQSSRSSRSSRHGSQSRRPNMKTFQ
uniref:FAD-binding PCMH-type domain-containing protein n=1 Tax=Branchiostoma floridae TaxID=7739 RepID=C3ZP75_BRAFL|eukprot:XP_002589561.1 hypothetical protein BRAFLDRAFT_81518 [Branchiostoma floridae]